MLVPEKHLTGSLFIYLGNHWFSMGLDPTRYVSVCQVIDEKKANNEVIYFIDTQNRPHAAIDSPYLIKTGVGDLISTQTKNLAPKDAVYYSLFKKDGVIETQESSYQDYATISNRLAETMRQDKINDNPNGLIAYNSFYSCDCYCSNRTLLLKGCPSTSGKECQTIAGGQLKRWK